MDSKRFNLASHWAELGASFQMIFIKEIDFRNLMIITKVWNPTWRFILLEIDHNVVTPESNLNSDALWLKLSQFAEQTQKQFADFQASHERMKTSTASMDKIVKTLQEGHAQLRKASEETNKRLNLVFEEKHHRKRGRDCLDQDINKLFNVYHNMNPQQQVHVMDNPYHQDDIKQDSMLMNNAISPSKYQDG
ncbi:hypothetical protein O181_007541 [Austropuccinia psidii MF-1]|uniref:Uncharacterized protein n=1 Tax=Austropuccinia psidii MF-1 TaxID=1389203 RepID=A0A9Q3BN15_9BASI|nr:hypothetical protein [Austropuccinia psidii MF-1]